MGYSAQRYLFSAVICIIGAVIGIAANTHATVGTYIVLGLGALSLAAAYICR